jgi:XisH protein
MPARDRHHARVRRALEKDGWAITHDPLHLRWGPRDLYVDLGAEQLLAAERGALKIAVEVKMFAGTSAIEDLQHALGQFVMYHDVLARLEADRVLYLAVANDIRDELFDEPLGRLLLENDRVRLLVFDPTKEVITSWTPSPPTAT